MIKDELSEICPPNLSIRAQARKKGGDELRKEKGELPRWVGKNNDHEG